MLLAVALIWLILALGLLFWGASKKDFAFWTFGSILLLIFGMAIGGQGIEKQTGIAYTNDVNGHVVQEDFIFQNVNRSVDPVGVGTLQDIGWYGGIVCLLIGFTYILNIANSKRNSGR